MKTASTSCRDCAFYSECGGWTLPGEEESLLTCFEAFGNSKNLFIDPRRKNEFHQRLAEVKFFQKTHSGPFKVADLTDFPNYLTLVQGGLFFKRPLNLSHAALNLVEIFHGDKKRGLKFGQRLQTADSLRQDWGLNLDTKVILSGVADDPKLERLWSNYRALDLAEQISRMRISAVTAPNFTFWKNAPRLESLINRRRMLRIVEALTDRGIPVIPHINSTHPTDWNWTLNFFQEHPELTQLCMEFRTGNRVKEVRQRKIKELVNLQDKLGRKIHPVIIGNTEAVREVRASFCQVTAIDSMPALKTIKRQRAIQHTHSSPIWRKEPVASKDCMADLFEENFNAHNSYLKTRFALPARTQGSFGTKVSPQKTWRAAIRLTQGELQLKLA